MPRNITVSFNDGSSHLYRNVPDNVTPDQVTDRASREFNKSVAHIDGGNSASMGAPAETTDVRSARYRQAGAAQANDLSSFPMLSAAAAGFERSLFGIPERIEALPLAYLPSEITGEPKDTTYGDALNQVRGYIDAERERSTTGNILGSLAGSLAGGSAILKGAKAVGGNAIARLVELEQGPGTKSRNLARIAGLGATTGAAQGVGEGSDPVESAVTGGLAGVGANALSSAAKPISRLVADNFHISSNDNILKRLVSGTSAQDLKDRYANFLNATNGAQPTTYEMLSPADRTKLISGLVANRPDLADRANKAIDTRLRNLGQEMQNSVNAATKNRGDAIATQLADSKIGGGKTSPLDIDQYRSQQAKEIIGPHQDSPVADSISHLIDPNYTEGDKLPAGDVATLIRRAASTLNQRKGPIELGAEADKPITFEEAYSVLSRLRKYQNLSGPDKLVAEDAIQHLENRLNDSGPVQAMKNAYAANSRLLEGVQEGRRGRLENEVGDPTQAVKNAYRSDEGTAGRFLGQRDQINERFENSPIENVRALKDLSQGDTRALSQNLGTEEALRIKNAAAAQNENVINLLSPRPRPQRNDPYESHNLSKSLARLSPSNLFNAKYLIAKNLFFGHRIPEQRAKSIVDMIFSTDPNMVEHAIGLLRQEPEGAKAIKGIVATVGNLSAQSTQKRDTQ